MQKQVVILSIFLSILMCFTIEKPNFYSVFSSENKSKIDELIKDIKSIKPTSLSNAYLGALLMKNAGLEQNPITKLKFFKEGHLLLETEISKFPTNVEYRFLRFVIQESAPKFLGYDNNIQVDKNIIVKNYKTLEPFLQNYIMSFSLKSKLLTSKELPK